MNNPSPPLPQSFAVATMALPAAASAAAGVARAGAAATAGAVRDVAATLRIAQGLQANAGGRAGTPHRSTAMQWMMYYCTRVGLDMAALPPVIHIAGTKGKGSTAAMTESILRARGLRTGLFTSPHLMQPMERFRVNGAPVPEALYLRHFWAAWDALFWSGDVRCLPAALRSAYAPPGWADAPTASHADGKDMATAATGDNRGSGSAAGGADGSDTVSGAPLSPPPLPPPPPPLLGFTFFTLVGLSLFTEAAVDVLVLEVGLGGRMDATNVVPTPVVCGVTTLDFDHVELLGHTLEAIAYEKAGVFKPGVPAVTVPQRADALVQLARVAAHVGTPLFVADPAALAARFPDGAAPRLGIAGDFQQVNAALAVALSDLFMRCRPAAGFLSGGAAANAEPLAVAVGLGLGSSPVPLATAFGSASPPYRGWLPSAALDAGAPLCGLPPYAPGGPVDDATLRGLADVRWDGRTQHLILDVTTGKVAASASLLGGVEGVAPAQLGTHPRGAAVVHLYVDGAHTEASMMAALGWFLAASSAQTNGAGSGPRGRVHALAAADAPGGVTREGVAPSGGRVRRALVRRALVFNSGTDKDTLSLLLPLSTVAWDAVYVCSVDWQLTPRTTTLPLDAAVAHCVRRKQLAEDAVTVAELEAGAAAEAAAEEYAPGPATLADGVPAALAWQATQLQLLSEVCSRSRFAATRRRLAAALAASSGDAAAASAAPSAPLPTLPPLCAVVANFAAASAAIRALAATVGRGDGGGGGGGGGVGWEGEVWHVCVTGSLYLAGAALHEVGWRTCP
jgi:folylpolyglutamate synthase/dihydropteroate synthase